MNERFRKLFISAMAILTGVLLLFPVGLWGVYADDDNIGNSNEENLTWQFNNPYVFSKAIQSAGYPYTRLRFGTSNTNSLVTSTPVYAFNYRVKNQDGTVTANWKTVFFAYSSTSFGSGNNANMVRYDYSSDKLTWYAVSSTAVNTLYTANVEGADTICYGYATYSNNSPYNYIGENMPNECPRIILNYGQEVTSILWLFSTHDFSYIPWNFSTSSGGMHFEDGSELSPSNTSTFSQVYLIMDVNHDNSVSEEEVNYYNYTYNTSYDYSEINEGNDFNQMEFLNWIALMIAQGNDNPSGGTGEGGGSSAIGGGASINVSEGAFTQTQTQSIEENAVNVTVNNNNELSQENMQYLNNVINNNLGTEGNAFGDAISAISGFSAVARSFAGLVSIMFGFLPSWVLTIMGLMFTILFVFIVFRLIHLFI